MSSPVHGFPTPTTSISVCLRSSAKQFSSLLLLPKNVTIFSAVCDIISRLETEVANQFLRLKNRRTEECLRMKLLDVLGNMVCEVFGVLRDECLFTKAAWLFRWDYCKFGWFFCFYSFVVYQCHGIQNWRFLNWDKRTESKIIHLIKCYWDAPKKCHLWNNFKNQCPSQNPYFSLLLFFAEFRCREGAGGLKRVKFT